MRDSSSTGEGQKGFIVRYRKPLIFGIVMAVGIVVISNAGSGKRESTPRPPERMVSIQLPPPPLPPPPPPLKLPPPPQVEQKMVEQAPVAEPEAKPDNQPAKVDDPPALGTNISGNGPSDGFGLGNSGNAGLIGGNGKGTKANSRFGWYAGQIQTKIEEALRSNRKTRSANLRIDVRIWPDATGHITRANLVSSTGDPAIDEAIKSEVLTGLQLKEPPPQGMPLPITIRITVRRPR